ncbi:peptidase E [Shewanella mangrovi]|uniref:Peptidase E n=1 Tax=Shewanella mangrovi TaxID=1515746 RepID=A0A094K2A5_9GAMM|nr:dipeptidase PepE [Shewanella mangrovi]KFZ38806.1 peptidase E [Shewanella mangrovi]
MTANALLLSSSRAGDTLYLEHALPLIAAMTNHTKKWLFIPYAGVSKPYEQYLETVASALAPLQLDISSIHQHGDPKQAIKDADGIIVGGGNTFHLLHELYRYDLVHLIREEVAAGKPYIGWSAGSNIAGQSIRTTNDMPIIEPPSFTALGLIPFQINPHYSNATIAGHNGESRAQRILEFTCVDPLTPVLGIQEGTALKLDGDKLQLIGDLPAFLFSGQEQEIPVPAGSDLSHMLS